MQQSSQHLVDVHYLRLWQINVYIITGLYYYRLVREETIMKSYTEFRLNRRAFDMICDVC